MLLSANKTSNLFANCFSSDSSTCNQIRNISAFFGPHCAPCSMKKRTLVLHQNQDRTDTPFSPSRSENTSSQCYNALCYRCGSSKYHRNDCITLREKNGYRGALGSYPCSIHKHDAKSVHADNQYGFPGCHLANCIRFAIIAWETEEIRTILPQTVKEYRTGWNSNRRRKDKIGIHAVCASILHNVFELTEHE